MLIAAMELACLLAVRWMVEDLEWGRLLEADAAVAASFVPFGIALSKQAVVMSKAFL